ncbi:deleted in malignant brain tumors 1 protein-like [Pomacea canaliculata]|uniref:deleted in malignant brain tumors 1 protein-like n=1 Tax=Pomacea canaliculata TaxID=400727 RepID=UPI000D72C2C4|nr:deleted in malignant brain tumors 1 protein-like [Pomacea canaliculata]
MKLQSVVSTYLISLILLTCLAEPMKARVVNGTLEAGRLEIYFNVEGGTACNFMFEIEEATVACGMLGFNSTEAAIDKLVEYKQSSSHIVMYDVRCSGAETILVQCSHKYFLFHDCNDVEDVVVICKKTEPMKARVVNGTLEAGRLEIYFNGEWRTVCDKGFGKEEVTVACRMLGFNSNEAAAVSSVRYGQGSGPILKDNLQCSGSETSLAQCLSFYTASCEHSQDIGVICNITELMKVRLVNGNSVAGRLEIHFSGTWETVCDYGFEKEDALVACRMLGFNSTEAAAVSSVRYGQGSGHILLKDVRCRGTETSLAKCSHGEFYPQKCNHSQDVGVICNITEQMKARLVNGRSKAGRLEVFFNGEWSTVCNKGFGNKEARVACRMLQVNSSEVAVVPTVRYGRGSGHILLSNIWCSGEEASLAQCYHGLLYPQDCDHSNDVGVVCNIKNHVHV